MKNPANLSTAQQAVEIVLSDYDALIEIGTSHAAALDTVSGLHGVARHKLAAVVLYRDMGLYGNTGSTNVAVLSTPSATAGTAPLDIIPDFPQ